LPSDHDVQLVRVPRLELLEGLVLGERALFLAEREQDLAQREPGELGVGIAPESVAERVDGLRQAAERCIDVTQVGVGFVRRSPALVTEGGVGAVLALAPGDTSCRASSLRGRWKVESAATLALIDQNGQGRPLTAEGQRRRLSAPGPHARVMGAKYERIGG
jgi:hypothetical protein